jgi:hypothetical protein
MFKREKWVGLASVGGVMMLLLTLAACGGPPPSRTEDFADCLKCHEGIEATSENHPFECAACHVGQGDRAEGRLTDHGKIVSNPSAPDQWSRFCLPCHREEIDRVARSLHGTLAGVINQTRYLWGAQASADPPLYGLGGGLVPLPVPDPLVYPETPPDLVDDFLRRRCLRCHLYDRGPGGRGLYRSTGCAACHVLYGDDGLYVGRDRAIARDRPGHPAFHRFTKRIPNGQCLHCHSGNHVGADYEGRFEADFSDTYRYGVWPAGERPVEYGLPDHRLRKDVHAEKGLWCIDCHQRSDIMGDGAVHGYQLAVVKRTCTDCHGGFGRALPLDGITQVRRGTAGFVFVSRVEGREHPLPLFDRASPGHDVAEHHRLRCSACHGQWSFQDYGLSVIREDALNGEKWASLTAQGDLELENTLKKYASDPGVVYPFSRDRLNGQERPGIWSMGWRFRRWEPMPLGVDQNGRYSVIRPFYQYQVSYVDRLGNVAVDSVTPLRGDGGGIGWAFMPYVPHTVGPVGRSCDSCHLNRVTAGLGAQQVLTEDTGLTVPSPPALSSMRLLNEAERQRLLNPSERWRKGRFRALMKTNRRISNVECPMQK